MSAQFLLQNYTRYPLSVDAGEGCYIWDGAGNRYLDLITGIGVNAFGYSHPRLTAALVEQARNCVHTSNLVSHRNQEKLAERLCQISGMDRAFFSNSGTEAMEAAIKALRARSSEGKSRIVALHGSFHGRTLGSLTITGQPDLRQRFAFSGADIVFIHPNNLTELHAAMTDDVAAIILEPVLGEGGIYPLTDEYLVTARELSHHVGAWLVADEVQCGLGRTARYFAYQWSGIQPDIVVTAKPLAAGLPLGATLFTEEAAQWLPPHSHGSTFGGGPLACRVALEFLDLLEETLPELGERASQFRQRLDCLKRRHPGIAEIRSKGMMFGIQLSEPGQRFVNAALAEGLLINCTQENVLRMLPAYIISEAEMDEAGKILDQVLGQETEGQLSRVI